MLLHLLCCHKCGHKFVAICCVTLSLKRSMDKWTFFHPNKRVNRATLRYRRNSFNLHLILNSNRKNKFRVLMKSKENLWIAASMFFSFFYSFFLLLFFFFIGLIIILLGARLLFTKVIVRRCSYNFCKMYRKASVPESLF